MLLLSLTGCSGGVLEPEGPIGAENLKIMYNALALAFGMLIVTPIIAGLLWTMAQLNHNMLPMHQMMQMQQ
jgi:hypothetical protein